MEAKKQVPATWTLLLDETTINRTISRIAHEILERVPAKTPLAIVGIRTYGEHIAKRLADKVGEISGKQPLYGVIDITLYRDDVLNNSTHPLLKETDLAFPITGTHIVLVDDVLFTGRTVRSALDAIVDFGRPHCVELAVLVDRGHRELPIRADYVGKNIPSELKDSIKVIMKEGGYDSDGVYLKR